jgi:branched-chain amino acid transport system substrate-binding protein
MSLAFALGRTALLDKFLGLFKKPNESKEPWDFYRIISTIPGDQAFRPLSEGGCALVK